MSITVVIPEREGGSSAEIATAVETCEAAAALVTPIFDYTADIEALAPLTDELAALGPIAANIVTVAGISANVTSVAGNATNINTVATNIANVNTVAGISGNVTTVAGISANVTSVAGNATNINIVAGIAADVTTVAGIDVDAVAANAAATAADRVQTGLDAAAALAAANSAGLADIFDTKALADAGLSGLANGDIVDVLVDEGRQNRHTRYRKESGVYVFKRFIDAAVGEVGSADSYRFGFQYSSQDATAQGSWAFDGLSSYPNKIGINNTHPADDPSWGSRADDTGYVAGAADVAAVVSGYDNICNALAGLIGSQHSMIYSTATHATIIGGSLHTIYGGSDYASIYGGTSNKIEADCDYSAIVGGEANIIEAGASVALSGQRGVIFGGISNKVSGQYGGIFAGRQNTTTGTYATILNGELCTADANHAIAAGNTVVVSGAYSMGVGNTITVSGVRSFALGDTITLASDYTFGVGQYLIAPFPACRVFGVRHRGSVSGRNQSLDFGCSQETTDTTTTRLSTYGSSGFPVQPTDSIVSGFALVNAVNTATGACSSFRIDFVSERIGTGTPTLRQNATTTSYNGLALSTVPTMNVTTGGVYRVQVVGLAATNIAWDCRVVCQQTVWTA